MACADFTRLYPKGSQSDYDGYIQQLSAEQGQLCVVANYQPCRNECSQMSKNYSGCASCLSSYTSCPKQGSNPQNKEPCCPNVGAAIQCANCLGLYDTNALEQCLKQGLSLGAIIGITIGVFVAVIIIVLGIYFGIKKYKERRELTNRLVGSKYDNDAIIEMFAKSRNLD